MIGVHPLRAIGEVGPGCDLGVLLRQALAHADLRIEAGDVLVVTQKIVSKAEGRFVDLTMVIPGAEAERLAALCRKDPRIVQLVLDESVAIVRAVPHVLIARHRSGHVMANAGIDRSNLGAGSADRVLLLPQDADASAARIRDAVGEDGVRPAVVISDSFGRPWRLAPPTSAIGAAGFASLVDWRGTPDREGRPLEVTQVALADMVAAAAGLVCGEGREGIPAVLVRGLHWDAPDLPAAGLIRSAAEDLFA